jgi:hypothetical protein
LKSPKCIDFSCELLRLALLARGELTENICEESLKVWNVSSLINQAMMKHLFKKYVPITRLFLLFFITVVKTTSSIAADSLILKKPFAHALNYYINAAGFLEPLQKTIGFPDGENLLDYLLPGKPFVLKQKINNSIFYTVNNHVDFKNCLFFGTELSTKGLETDTNYYNFKGNLDFSNTEFDRYGYLSNIQVPLKNALSFVNCKAESFVLYRINGNIDVGSTTFQSFFSTLECNISTINFFGNSFTTDTADARFGKTSFHSSFTFELSKNRYTRILFAEDTLEGSFEFISDSLKNLKKDSKVLVSVRKSYINGTFESSFDVSSSTLKFDNCSFGPDANLSALKFDTVVFNNCFNIPSPVFLNFDKSKTKVYLTFSNTNITNLEFDYDNRIVLQFDSASNNDLKTNTFENLLAKLRTDGKFESYRNVDIAYQQYQYRLKGLWGAFTNLLNKSWWDYGYKKYYILYWTTAFLLIFFLINIFLWEKMEEVYPIMSSDKVNYYHLRSNPLKYK